MSIKIIIQQLISFFLYLDPERSVLNIDRLPDNILPALKEFYEQLQDGAISDIFEREEGSSQTSGVTAAFSTSTTDYFSKEFSAYCNTTAGEAWFKLCSNLKGCTYLSATSDGAISYELRPTMSNVCHALQILLGGPPTLVSLKSFEQFWNITCDGLVNGNEITVVEKRLSFRAPFSDTETIHREVGVIAFKKSRIELEVELEDAHRLAAVKHRNIDSNSQIWCGEPMFGMIKDSWIKGTGLNSPNYFGINLAVTVLQSVILSDHMLRLLPSIDHPIPEEKLVHSLLSARWGEEQNSFILGERGSMATLGASFTDDNFLKHKSNHVVHYLMAIKNVVSSPPYLCQKDLFTWLLKELPDGIRIERLAMAIRIAPESFLQNPDIAYKIKQLRNGNLLFMMSKKSLFFGKVDNKITLSLFENCRLGVFLILNQVRNIFPFL